MTQIKFTIPGNQENPAGNPIPKARLTQGQQWTPIARRYSAWKEYVQQLFHPHLVACAIDMPNLPFEKVKQGGRYLKPITLSKNMRMDLRIHWATENHADPESIFGSVADAIFVDDKHLEGSFFAFHSPDKKGRVEVKITIP